MATFTQENRLLRVTSVLGEDVLLLQSFTGREAISRLFSYQLELLSEDDSIAAKDLVGTSLTWMVQDVDKEPRYFNGMVSRMSAGGMGARGLRAYRVEVVPKLWFLTRTANCKIFQNKTTPVIVQSILDDFGISDYELKLTGKYNPRDYCVQYRETAFNFISRLMEQDGIFYFFQHDDGKHTLVLADAKGAFQDCVENSVRFSGGTLAPNHVASWEHQYEYRSGKWAATDYNFETPSTSLLSSSNSKLSLQNIASYEIFDYPGLFTKTADGAAEVQLRMEEEEASFDVVAGSSQCCTFTPGGKFELEDHEISSEQGKYVITSILHTAADTSYGDTSRRAEYSNSFTCIPDSVAYRPGRLTPKPIVQGPQTAVVVGPAGEEIYTDKYGRIKVQFFWDRLGQKDENSSCWIRLAQNWAGKGWGAISIPRIGQEVIVDFLEGDPDRPIITGRVYNAEQMPPFPLPAGKVVSGIKSKTHKGAGYNEMSFDDTAGKEKITIHGQYDMGTTVEHDHTLTVHNDRKITIDGTHTEKIKEETKITIIKGPYSHDVADNTATYHVKKNLTEHYEANQSTTVDGNLTIQVTGAGEGGGGEVLLWAKEKIVLHTGESKLTMMKDGTILLEGRQITVKGSERIREDAPEVEITGSKAAKIGVGSQNTIYDTTKVGVSGASINSSAVGIHEITGAVVKIN